jgi:hypothetical protein
VSFVHENAQEFADLVQIVAGERGLRRSIVEKDYSPLPHQGPSPRNSF